MDSYFPSRPCQPVSISAGASGKWRDSDTLSFFPLARTLLSVRPECQQAELKEAAAADQAVRPPFPAPSGADAAGLDVGKPDSPYLGKQNSQGLPLSSWESSGRFSFILNHGSNCGADTLGLKVIQCDTLPSVSRRLVLVGESRTDGKFHVSSPRQP